MPTAYLLPAFLFVQQLEVQKRIFAGPFFKPAKLSLGRAKGPRVKIGLLALAKQKVLIEN